MRIQQIHSLMYPLSDYDKNVVSSYLNFRRKIKQEENISLSLFEDQFEDDFDYIS